MGGRVVGGLAPLPVGLLGTGCAAFDTQDDVRRARKPAEWSYPGELEVVDARILFPETTGSEATPSIAGEPDGAVRVRVDASSCPRCARGARTP